MPLISLYTIEAVFYDSEPKIIHAVIWLPNEVGEPELGILPATSVSARSLYGIDSAFLREGRVCIH